MHGCFNRTKYFSKSFIIGKTGRYINVQHCGGLSMFLLQLNGPLELFVKQVPI